MKDIPLPSGRLATMRPMTWLDWLATATAPNFDMRVMIAACRLTTIDGKPLTIDEASLMTMFEAGLLIRAVGEELAMAFAPKEASPADESARRTLQ